MVYIEVYVFMIEQLRVWLGGFFYYVYCCSYMYQINLIFEILLNFIFSKVGLENINKFKIYFF